MENVYNALKDLQIALGTPKNAKTAISSGNLIYLNDTHQIVYQLYTRSYLKYSIWDESFIGIKYTVQSLSGNVLVEGQEKFNKIIAFYGDSSAYIPGWYYVENERNEVYKFIDDFNNNIHLEEYEAQCIEELKNVLNLYMGE